MVMLFAGFASARTNTPDSKINFHFATLEEGQQIISASDEFTQSLHKFDLVSRLQEAGMEPTRENYRLLGKKSVMAWTEVEKQHINEAAAYLQHRIDSCGYKLPIPEDITLIKTSMVEEGRAAGYTRGTNIFLASCEKMTPRGKAFLKVLLAHELFHVLTRTCPDFREAMYAQIGFKLIGHDIKANDKLLEMRITNPDVNRYDSYSMFTIDGRKIPCAMWFHTDTFDYKGGPFFTYGKPGLLPLDKDFNPILNEDGTPVIYPTEKASDFFDMVGKNTSYIINPEEVLADNFAFALLDYFMEGNPSPEVTARLREVMKGTWIKK